MVDHFTAEIVYIEQYSFKDPQRKKIKKNEYLTIGRDKKNNNISIDTGYVSNLHGRIYLNKEGKIRYDDFSTNGTRIIRQDKFDSHIEKVHNSSTLLIPGDMVYLDFLGNGVLIRVFLL